MSDIRVALWSYWFPNRFALGKLHRLWRRLRFDGNEGGLGVGFDFPYLLRLSDVHGAPQSWMGTP